MTTNKQTQHDWTTFFNERFGRYNTRRNVEIFTPIVVDFTSPQTWFNNGTTVPPTAVQTYHTLTAPAENALNELIPLQDTSNSGAYNGLDTNPNYKGDGKYFPEYTRMGVIIPEYPEGDGGNRGPLNKPRREIPLEVRRRLLPAF